MFRSSQKWHLVYGKRNVVPKGFKALMGINALRIEKNAAILSRSEKVCVLAV